MNVESDGKLERGGDSLSHAGTDEGAGSGRHRVKASAKSKFELSNLSRASAKVIDIIELLSGVSGNASIGTEILRPSSSKRLSSEGSRVLQSNAGRGSRSSVSEGG